MARSTPDLRNALLFLWQRYAPTLTASTKMKQEATPIVTQSCRKTRRKTCSGGMGQGRARDAWPHVPRLADAMLPDGVHACHDRRQAHLAHKALPDLALRKGCMAGGRGVRNKRGMLGTSHHAHKLADAAPMGPLKALARALTCCIGSRLRGLLIVPIKVALRGWLGCLRAHRLRLARWRRVRCVAGRRLAIAGLLTVACCRVAWRRWRKLRPSRGCSVWGRAIGGGWVRGRTSSSLRRRSACNPCQALLSGGGQQARQVLPLTTSK